MNALDIRNLTKTFSDFKLDGLDLTLPSGCILGLVGENGAGKSTTIKLILGMLQKESGSISILGKDESERTAVKEELGVVLDEPGFPACMTPKQVGKMMAKIYRQWDGAMYDALLTRLDIPASKKYQAFSQGTKMKLGIAVALSHHPRLLILDEATNGLDPVVRDEVVEMFSEFTRDEDHAVLISSHIVSDLEKICDYIAFLHQGKLMVFEEKDALKERFGILRCEASTLAALDSAAIIGQRSSPYGVEAIIRRDALPDGTEVSPVSIEELFIFMTKEAN